MKPVTDPLADMFKSYGDRLRQGQYTKAKNCLQHITRRKYILRCLSPYNLKRWDKRKLRRIFGYAYDDMVTGELNLL